jgi:hypothetical protein
MNRGRDPPMAGSELPTMSSKSLVDSMPTDGSARPIVLAQALVEVFLFGGADQLLVGDLHLGRAGRLGIELRPRQPAVVVVVQLPEIAPVVALRFGRADQAVAVFIMPGPNRGELLDPLGRIARHRRSCGETRRRSEPLLRRLAAAGDPDQRAPDAYSRDQACGACSDHLRSPDNHAL